MIKYQRIKGVHLEISSRCNAACPDCPRNIRGYGVADENFDPRAMTLAEAQKIFVPKFVQQLTGVLINGNYGDFITCRDGLKIVQYLHQHNPDIYIEISTNASGQPDIWSDLGAIPNMKVAFRIDGLEDTHHFYRQDTDYNLIIENAKKFIAAGGFAEWAMIEFDYNEHQIEQARQLSQQLGFKQFRLVNVDRNNMPVFNRQGEFVRNIGTVVRPITLEELQEGSRYKRLNHVELNREHRSKVETKHIICPAAQGQNIYIQSNGQVYPCCWTGFWPDKNLECPGNDQIRALSHNNNAIEVGLEQAIKWFAELEKTWTIPTVAEGRAYICNQTCGKS